MNVRTLIPIALPLTILPGCVGDRVYRPGPLHAGLRSFIYEHTPIAGKPVRGQFVDRPRRPTGQINLEPSRRSDWTNN